MFTNVLTFQRPTAKDLLRHPFVKKAKRNSHLHDLIDRYQKWKLTHANDNDTDDSDTDNSESGEHNDNSDSEWDINTIKDPSGKLMEQFRHQNGNHDVAVLTSSEPDREDEISKKAIVAAAAFAAAEIGASKARSELNLVVSSFWKM